MLGQHAFQLRSSDVDPSANDDVVVAALVMKESFAIPDVNVARHVPAPPDIVLLRINRLQVTATGWAFHGEQSLSSIRNGLHALLIDNDRFIARNNFSCGSWPGTAATRGDKNMQHFCGAKAVQDLDTGQVSPGTVHRCRQGFTGADCQS